MLGLVVVAYASEIDVEWEEWKEKYNKVYNDGAEESHRFSIWKENRAMILSHNKKDKSYTMAVNKFADLTSEEFRYKIHGHGNSCSLTF